MPKLASWLLAGILSTLAAGHVYWALGGRRGVQLAFPLRTSPAAQLNAAMMLLMGVGAVLAPYDPNLKAYALRGMAVIFALTAIGDFQHDGGVRRSREAGFAYWVPLQTHVCLVMALLAVAASLA